MARTHFIRLKEARREGKKDGKKRYPPAEFDGTSGKISEFENRLALAASAEMQDIVRRWEEISGTILMEIQTLLPDLEGAIKNFQDSLTAHRSRFGPNVHPEPRHKRSLSSSVILFLLFLFEAGVNAYTFRFLREPGTTTVLMGLALALLIPFSGFLIGRISKSKWNDVAEWITAATLSCAVVALILIVALGRKIGIATRNLGPAVVDEVFWIFLVMNVILFVIALWDGYASGYTFPKLQKSFEYLRTRKRQYMDRWGRLNKAFTSTINTVKLKVQSYGVLQNEYQKANREARQKVHDDAKGPEYFTNGTKLPVVYPSQIKDYLDEQQPFVRYINDLKGKGDYTFLDKAEDCISGIEKLLSGTAL